MLSDLANDLKFATNKRIKVEIAIIKLAKPAMEQSREIGEIISRITVLEEQLSKANEKLKNGIVMAAGYQQAANGVQDVAGAGETDSSIRNISAEQQAAEKKRIVEAMPEDIRQLARQWDDIVYSIDDMLTRTYLLQANVSLAKDNRSLELIFKSTSAYNTFVREEDRVRLQDIIEERTGMHADIVITKIDDNEDFQNRFTDIRDLVNMDIEVDDKEEFI